MKIDLNDKRYRVLLAIGLVLLFSILIFEHSTSSQNTKIEKAPTGRNTVYFDDGLLISPASKGALFALASVMNSDQTVTVTLIGHAIQLENEAETLQLSKEFADVVRIELMGHGVDRGRINIEAKGYQEPLIRRPGEIDEYYKTRQNRVEIIVSR
jgi:outer membrane protein OmpA-like peptidoglycan-associated protein